MLRCMETAHNSYSLWHGHNDMLKFSAADRILKCQFLLSARKMFILHCVKIRLMLSSGIVVYITAHEITKLMNYQSAIFRHFPAHNSCGTGIENYRHYSANIH